MPQRWTYRYQRTCYTEKHFARIFIKVKKKKVRWDKFINSSKVTQETLSKFRREYFKAIVKTLISDATLQNNLSLIPRIPCQYIPRL